MVGETSTSRFIIKSVFVFLFKRGSYTNEALVAEVPGLLVRSVEVVVMVVVVVVVVVCVCVHV